MHHAPLLQPLLLPLPSPLPSPSTSSSSSRHRPMRSSFKPFAGFLFATDLDSMTTPLLALRCAASFATTSDQKSGSELPATTGKQQGG
jgi:hypothetical protein